MPVLNPPNKVLSLITGQAVVGNAGVAVMARLRGNNGNLVTQASISTIVFAVYDITAASSITSSQSLTVSSVIYDALQQSDQLWTKDSAGSPGPDGEWGYNFKTVIPASHFTVAASGHRYQVDVLFTPVSGQQFRLPFQFGTQRVYA